MWSSCIALVSDSEIEFLRFENRFLIISFCLLIIFFLVFVFLFLHILLFFIRRSHLLLLIILLCNTISCLFQIVS